MHIHKSHRTSLPSKEEKTVSFWTRKNKFFQPLDGSVLNVFRHRDVSRIFCQNETNHSNNGPSGRKPKRDCCRIFPLFFAHGGAGERVFTVVLKCLKTYTHIFHHTHIHAYDIHSLCLVYLSHADAFINSSRSYENLFVNVILIPSLQWDGGLGGAFPPSSLHNASCSECHWSRLLHLSSNSWRCGEGCCVCRRGTISSGLTESCQGCYKEGKKSLCFASRN